MNLNLDINKVLGNMSSRVAELVVQVSVLQAENDLLKEKLAEKERVAKTEKNE